MKWQRNKTLEALSDKEVETLQESVQSNDCKDDQRTQDENGCTEK